MINREQVEEWIREVEARPSSAVLIIDYITRRLADLTQRNEDLLAENIELRSGRKVEEYESRIANLEYQVDLLKRQLGGVGDLPISAAPVVETLSIVLYNHKGRVLRAEVPAGDLKSREVAAALTSSLDMSEPAPRLLVVGSQEELVFLFDSGRTVTRPVADIPAWLACALDWKSATLIEPHGNEELCVVAPVGRMALFDACVQVSRKGCVKKMMRPAFETHLAKEYIGSGVKTKLDKPCELALSAKEDQFVLVTQEGFLVTLDAANLPYTSEEALKLGLTDYVVSGFPLARKPGLIIVTQNGKAINREVAWLEKSESSKSRGQSILSPARREAGVRLVGAAAVDDQDWAAALRCDGKVLVYRVADLFETGAFGETSDPPLAGFTTFKLASSSAKHGGK